jgi:DnaK suppressor protein
MTRPEETRSRRLERMLEERRAVLAADLERQLGEQLGEDTLTSQHEQIEIGDRSVSVLGQDVELGVIDMKRRELRQIDEALRRLHDGSYGVCRECGADIDDGRLEVLPFAVDCVECKRKREAEEAIEKTGRGFRAGFRDIRETDDDD